MSKKRTDLSMKKSYQYNAINISAQFRISMGLIAILFFAVAQGPVIVG